MSYEAAERRQTRIRKMKTQSILKYKKIPTGTNQYPSHFIENSKAIILENKENKLKQYSFYIILIKNRLFINSLNLNHNI